MRQENITVGLDDNGNCVLIYNDRTHEEFCVPIEDLLYLITDLKNIQTDVEYKH